MNRRPRTEGEVLALHEQRVALACARHDPQGRLEPDDRRAIARIGLLFALRTWEPGVSAFGPYAEDCMGRHLRQGIRTLNRLHRPESRLSLDQPVKNGDGETMGVRFVGGSGDVLNQVVFGDFMDSLEELPRRMAWLIIDRCTFDEIMRELGLDRQTMTALSAELAHCLLAYHGAECAQGRVGGKG